ncbi:MAG: hypothetical protein ABL983_13080 [Nitrospira sp.]
MNREEDDKDKQYSRIMRTGSFVAGCGFLVLGAVDAMFDPFPGPETFFAGTGVTLITIALTGKSPKGKE